MPRSVDIPKNGNPSGVPFSLTGRVRYAVITPARNEAAFIDRTIESMTAQTHLPVKWVIVSDGSTDGTERIVAAYLSRHPWIELVTLPQRPERHFGGKVMAFNAGLERLRGLEYDVIANLDADISFGPDYLEFLVDKFHLNPRLGVAGTPFTEGDHRYDYRFTSIEHVSGACQMFRRECFASIGGYVPQKIGGIDLVAVLSARMKGWETRTFIERTCQHHRPMGTAKRGRAMVAFRGGMGDFMLGTHPLWALLRTPYQMIQKPVFIGGVLRLVGYGWAAVQRVQKVVPDELVRFRRKEQMARLRALASRGIGRSAADGAVGTANR